MFAIATALVARLFQLVHHNHTEARGRKGGKEGGREGGREGLTSLLDDISNGDGLGGGLLQLVHHNHPKARSLNQFLGLIHIGALEADDDGFLHPDLLGRGEDPGGDDVTAHDPPEDIH